MSIVLILYLGNNIKVEEKSISDVSNMSLDATKKRKENNTNLMTSETQSEKIKSESNSKEESPGIVKEGKPKAYEKWINNEEEKDNATTPHTKSSNESWDLFWQNSYYKSKKDDVQEEDQANLKSQRMNFLERLVNRIIELFKMGL